MERRRRMPQIARATNESVPSQSAAEGMGQTEPDRLGRRSAPMTYTERYELAPALTDAAVEADWMAFGASQGARSLRVCPTEHVTIRAMGGELISPIGPLRQRDTSRHGGRSHPAGSGCLPLDGVPSGLLL